jgi:hypothetical protein
MMRVCKLIGKKSTAPIQIKARDEVNPRTGEKIVAEYIVHNNILYRAVAHTVSESQYQEVSQRVVIYS